MKKSCLPPLPKPTEKPRALEVFGGELWSEEGDLRAPKGYRLLYLDRFAHPLDRDDPRMEMVEGWYCRLAAERSYLGFFEALFAKNGGEALLFGLGADFSDPDVCVDKMERLDRIDSYIVLRLHKDLVRSEVYVVDDVTLLGFFVRGFLREAIDGGLYFENLDLAVIAGHDMVLPLFLGSDGAVYRELAARWKLWLRE